jgi:predicted RNase H-like nuclease
MLVAVSARSLRMGLKKDDLLDATVLRLQADAPSLA